MPSNVDAPPGLMGSIWRYKWLWLAIVVVCFALSTAAGFASGREYTAKASLALSSPGGTNVIAQGIVGDASLSRYTDQRAQYMLSDDVLTTVAQRVGSPSTTALRKRLTVTPSLTANIITVTATGVTPQSATDLANTVLEGYREVTAKEVTDKTNLAANAISRSEDRISTQVRKLGSADAQRLAAATSLAQLQKESADLFTDSDSFGDGVDFVRQAVASSAVDPGLPIRDMGLGLLIGLALATVVTWVRADRDPQVRDVRESSTLLDAPMLAAINAPQTSRGQFDLQPALDGFQMASSALATRVPKGVVIVVGCGVDTPRAEVSLGLAMGLEREKVNGLLVDGDLGQGRLSQRLFGGTGGEGLAQLLKEPERDPSADVAWFEVLPGANVAVLPTGDRETVALEGAASTEVLRAVAELRAQSDLVVIDADRFDDNPLTAALTRASDGVVVVVENGAHKADLAHVRRTADLYDARVLGFVYLGRDVG